MALTSFDLTDMGATQPSFHPLPASFCRLVPGAQQGWLDRNHRPILEFFVARTG